VTNCGGVTALIKIAHMAEAFNIVDSLAELG
jgi:L-alanine-DL-glutamate epimerase-like enolase superfamily enzyme